ncbi:MAG: serine/threonine protein kinase [uncultured bacterium]|nr:MAG: serine/threonine protein kinase [uncultured bacterium]
MSTPRSTGSTQQIQQELKEQTLEENQIDFVQPPAETIAKLNHALKDEKKDIVRYSKLYLKEKFNIEVKRGGIVRVKNDRNSFDLYMVCPGITLGEGGYGKVKLMQNIENPNDTLVLKVLNTKYMQDANIARQFRNEARNLEKMGRGKSTILSKERTENEKIKPEKLYLVQKFIPGEKLHFYLKNKKPELAELLDIALQTMQCAQELHQNNIIHRDIKIENFIYNPNIKKLTIVDFGITQEPNTPRNIEKTAPDKAYGSRGHIAPEIYSGENYTEKSDIYSLGKSIK